MRANLIIGNLGHLHESLQVGVNKRVTEILLRRGGCQQSENESEDIFPFHCRLKQWGGDHLSNLWLYSHIVQSTLLDDAQGPSHQDYEVSGAALWWISDLCHLYCTSVQWCTVSSTDLGGSNTPTGEDTTHLNHADRDLSSGKEVRSIEKMIVNCKYQQNVTPYVLTRMLGVMLTVKSCLKELILVS